MPGIRFGIAQMLQELESASTLTRAFTENGDYVFARVKTQLESLRDERNGASVAWEIPRSAPLRTIESAGEYESGGRGAKVSGELSFVWEIKRLPTVRRRDPAKEFQLVGKASTVARVFASETNGSKREELAMWRIEVGDDNSPGCHFHVQIRGEEDDGPFPKRLSVPRLPTCLASPMAALEFLLAELFQDAWRRNVSAETDALKRWRSIQSERMCKLFEWQSRTVSGVNQGSPWSKLKLAKPPADIFIA
jgi:hypothetical protein